MTTFDPRVMGTFHLKDGLFFRKVERRCLPRHDGLAESKNTENGGPNGNRAQPGIWWDVELTKCDFVPGDDGQPGHYEIVAQVLIDEGSWLSVVSSMGAGGETTQTYGMAQALHRAGNL